MCMLVHRCCVVPSRPILLSLDYCDTLGQIFFILVSEIYTLQGIHPGRPGRGGELRTGVRVVPGHVSRETRRSMISAAPTGRDIASL